MNYKSILISLLLIILALFLVTCISAANNDSVIFDNNANEDYNLEFNQTYGPSAIHKDELFDVYLNVKNAGLDTYHNLSILYPLPKGLDLVIFPAEYDNHTWFIDTLYPGEEDLLTLVCYSKLANKTYEFTAGIGSQTLMNSTLDVYILPDGNGNSSNHTDIFDGGSIKAASSIKNSDLSLKETANPILILLFAIIFIPYIRIKY